MSPLCFPLYFLSGSRSGPSQTLPIEPACSLLSGACVLSLRPALCHCGLPSWPSLPHSQSVALPEHSPLCLEVGAAENTGCRERRGHIWGALASLPEVGVNVPSQPALLWARWGPGAEGNSEKHELKPSQHLTVYEGCFTAGSGYLCVSIVNTPL